MCAWAQGVDGAGGHAHLDLDCPPSDHPGRGGLIDKSTKGKRARKVPIIEEGRELVARRLDVINADPDARLFTGPRGGRIAPRSFVTPRIGMTS
jgi:hypothetical protein